MRRPRGPPSRRIALGSRWLGTRAVHVVAAPTTSETAGALPGERTLMPLSGRTLIPMSGPCRTGSPGGGASPTRPRVRHPDLLLTRAEPPSRPPPGGGHARHPALVLEGRHLGGGNALAAVHR